MKLILSYLAKYKVILLLTLVLAIIQKIASFTEPYIIQKIIDDYLFLKRPEFEILKMVGILVLMAFGVTSIARLTSGIQTYLVLKLTKKIGNDIFIKSVSHYLNVDFSYIVEKSSGEILSSIKTARFNIEKFITELINVQFTFFISILIVLFYSYKIHWSIAPIIFIAIPIISLFVNLMNRKTKKIFETNFIESNLLFNKALETIRNIILVKSFGLVQQEGIRLKNTVLKIFLLDIEKAKKVNQILFFQNTAINMVRNLLIFYILMLVIQGKMTVGELVSLVMISNLILRPLQDAGNIITTYKEAKVSINYIENLLSTPAENNLNKEKLGKIDSLTVENLTFSYKEGVDALSNITFNIKKGETLAIVGASGSGKSTLLKLLIGLYFPTDGKVLYNNYRIENINLEMFRRQVGYVSQDHYFFSGSIRDNMKIVDKEVTDEEIFAALEIAECSYLMGESKEGLDTEIGESGIKLSGGEKQRLSIARTLLRNPKILLFDEVTSALDYETENNITRTMEKILGSGKYIGLIVSHRFSTVSFASNIIVLEKGKIVEMGNHEFLLKKNGYYSDYFFGSK